MDKITWLLGADASQVRTEMDKAVASVNRGTSQMTDGLERTTKRQDKLWESNNRVTNQVAGFARSLMNARNAADVLSSSLDRLENSTNLSLAGGIALAGGAVLIDQFSKFHTAYSALSADMEKMSGKHRGDLEKIIALRERLEAVQKSPYNRIGQDVAGGAGSPFGVILGAIAADAGRKRDLEKLDRMEEEAGVGKRRKRSDLRTDALNGAPDYETKARELQMAHDEANASVREMTQAAIELNIAFRELAKTVNEKHMERAGMSLKELAAMTESGVGALGYKAYRFGNTMTKGDDWGRNPTQQYNARGELLTQAGSWEAMTPGALEQSQKAKQVLALEAQAEAARLNMQPELAHNLFNQAGSIKEGMTSLKPSEKMAVDFKGALAVSEGYLKQLAESKAVLVNK